MYAELQCKSNFSFLRGASDSGEYIQRAVELGIEAIAITDVNGVYALPRAFEALKHCSRVKLISGCEIVIRDHSPVTFLARDRQAYGLMCRMLSAVHDGKAKGDGHLTLAELAMFLGRRESSGLVGLVAPSNKTNFPLLRDALGERLYLSLSRYQDGMDEERTQLALEVSARYGVRLVATNDVHYHVPERSRLQDALTCVREGVTIKKAGFKLFANEERYLKSPIQMCSMFRDLPDAIRATLDIAESCTFSLSELSYQYPSEWIPKGYTPQSYLEELVWSGAMDRYKGAIPIEVEKQILHEFTLTKKMEYADYFLTVYDIVKFAKDNGIYCQGRGSAANSVICYCLGITVIDPVRMNLLFERFISEERGEPPDIDVDFEHERREEVIQYIYTKYGRHRAAMISAVRTYQRRSAFLEMSKAIGVPVGTLSANALERDFDQYAGELKEKRDRIDGLMKELIGFPRHLSIHACGFTLSANPIIDTVPVEPATMPGRTICQWDKHDLDTLRLIKIDVLSLGFLTAIRKACKLIGIHFSDIPQEDDPKVYEMIQHGDTIGTFQIESRAQIATLGVTLPENFYDLVVEVALVRPGPNVGEMKSPYITRRENAKRGFPFKFDDPVTEKILGRTHGVPIFQEQVMKLAIEKAGFSPGEADELRRAIAAWRSAEAVDSLSVRFYDGLIAGGMLEERAKELFGYLKGFSAYGFPESHAASFAILSYLSAWLRCYHHDALLVGLINSQPMGFYPVDVLINDARRHGVSILPIDPNISVWDATLEGRQTVRMGFRNVKGIRREDVEHLLEERRRAPFSSVHDFLARTHFPRDVIETLAMSDVFSCFGQDQRHSFWKSIELRAFFERRESQQLSLFERNGAPEQVPDIFQPMSLYAGIIEDYRGLGYSLRGNAMKGIRSENKDLPQTSSLSIKKLQHGASATYAGVVLVLQRPPTANGVAFMTLEDEVGSVDLVFFKKVYDRYLHVIRNSRFLIIKGKVERRGRSMSVLVGHVITFDTKLAESTRQPVLP
jgi:error-prone DNA polymerase